MALTRAQLLMGDGGQGYVLPGQVQAVKEGNGITIYPNGTIEVDSQTAVGLMRLGQSQAYAEAAFNGYFWPLGVGTDDLGKQLTVDTIDGNGHATLAWQGGAIPSGTVMLFYQPAAPAGWIQNTSVNDAAIRVVSSVGGSTGGSGSFTSTFSSRAISGTVTGTNTGGSLSNTTVTGSVSGSNTGGGVSATTLSIAQMPVHDHSILFSKLGTSTSVNANLIGPVSSGFGWVVGLNPPGTPNAAPQGGFNFQQQTRNTYTQGSGSSHTHGFTNPAWSGTLTTNAHTHTMTNPTWAGTLSINNLNMDVLYADVIICTKI